MASARPSAELDFGTVIREGATIGAILLVWSVFAAVAAIVGDMAPRGSPLIPVSRGLIWFFLVVGCANILFYIIVASMAFHHRLWTS